MLSQAEQANELAQILLASHRIHGVPHDLMEQNTMSDYLKDVLFFCSDIFVALRDENNDAINKQKNQ